MVLNHSTMTIKVQNQENKGRFNLRVIEIGKKVGSRGISSIHSGVTDKGREVYVCFFGDDTAGVKDTKNVNQFSVGSIGWGNLYNIIETIN